MELEYHGKLEFVKLKYPKNGTYLQNNSRLIYISVNIVIVTF